MNIERRKKEMEKMVGGEYKQLERNDFDGGRVARGHDKEDEK